MKNLQISALSIHCFRVLVPILFISFKIDDNITFDSGFLLSDVLSCFSIVLLLLLFRRTVYDIALFLSESSPIDLLTLQSNH